MCYTFHGVTKICTREQLNPSEVAQKAIHVVQGPEVTRCRLGRIVMEKFIAGENVMDPGVIFKSKTLKKKKKKKKVS